jgi:hypothetical protein
MVSTRRRQEELAVRVGGRGIEGVDAEVERLTHEGGGAVGSTAPSLPEDIGAAGAQAEQ